MPKVQVVRAKGGWFFRIVASNGRTLCHSEIYKTKGHCRRTAIKIKGVRPWKVEEV